MIDCGNTHSVTAVKDVKQKKLSPKEQFLEAVANSKGQVRQKT